MRVRLRREDATLCHVPSLSGHRGLPVPQHVEEETRPEPTEGGLRGEIVTKNSVAKPVSFHFLMIEIPSNTNCIQ